MTSLVSFGSTTFYYGFRDFIRIRAYFLMDHGRDLPEGVALKLISFWHFSYILRASIFLSNALFLDFFLKS